MSSSLRVPILTLSLLLERPETLKAALLCFKLTSLNHAHQVAETKQKLRGKWLPTLRSSMKGILDFYGLAGAAIAHCKDKSKAI